VRGKRRIGDAFPAENLMDVLKQYIVGHGSSIRMSIR